MPNKCCEFVLEIAWKGQHQHALVADLANVIHANSKEEQLDNLGGRSSHLYEVGGGSRIMSVECVIHYLKAHWKPLRIHRCQ